MKRLCLSSLLLFLLSISTLLAAQSTSISPVQSDSSRINASAAKMENQAAIRESYGKLPLSFEANQGQADGRVKFMSRTGSYSLFLTGNEAVLALRSGNGKNDKEKTEKNAVLRMQLRNANAEAKVSGVDLQAGVNNYFAGNDPAKWRTNVPTYSKVKYESIYSGIDLIYYGNQRQLEYDFVVAPGASPSRIAFDISGAKQIRQDTQGDLVFKVGDQEIRWHKPVVYQEKNGARELIQARYALTNANRVSFELAKYDAKKTLYIDPLIYSTYLGGSGADNGLSIAVDSAGSAYVVGTTASTNFPTTTHAFETTCCGAFVTKLNPAGSALIYSTYIAGNDGVIANHVAIDSEGNAYIVGETWSTNFPTTTGAFQTVCNGGTSCSSFGDGFVTKLNSTGTGLVYSTYLGGTATDYASSVAVDASGDAYVTGTTGSTDFPTTAGAFETTCCGAFVTKVNATGTALIYSTYLHALSGASIAIDGSGDAYVTGKTSSGLPTVNPIQGWGGNYDSFVSKFNPTGTGLVYSTYLGGSGVDTGNAIAVDSTGAAYVTGQTESTDFPTTPGAFSTVCNKGNNCAHYGDAFVTKINPAGSALVFSTYLGGGGADYGNGIAVGSAGDVYAAGYTASSNFPVKNSLYPYRGGDTYITKFNPGGTAQIYSTLIGGSQIDTGNAIALDSAGNAYVTGQTSSSDFPIVNGFQASYGGGEGDAFVAKVFIQATTATSLTSSPNPSGFGQTVTFTAEVTSTGGVPPNEETVSFMKGKTVLGTGELSGDSASFTISTLPVGSSAVTAVYAGDSNFAASTSKAVTQVVDKATTTTGLTSSLNPSNEGQSVTFTATVASQFSAATKGTVSFYDGSTLLKSVALSGGVAKLTTTKLASGTHAIMATYNGNVDFDTSSNSLSQKVN